MKKSLSTLALLGILSGCENKRETKIIYPETIIIRGKVIEEGYDEPKGFYFKFEAYDDDWGVCPHEVKSTEKINQMVENGDNLWLRIPTHDLRSEYLAKVEIYRYWR